MGEDESGYVDSDEPLTDRSCVRCAHHRTNPEFGDGPITHLCQRPQFGSTRNRVIGVDVPNSRDAYRERADNVALGLGEADDRCKPATAQAASSEKLR